MTAPQPDTPLDALRQEIDAIDGQILALLIRRFAATDKVKASKTSDGSLSSSPLRPAREAVMLRRLIAESAGRLQPQTLVRLWRVILSASIQSQAPVTLHIDRELGEDPIRHTAMAQHFCDMTVACHDSAAEVLGLLKGRRGDLAILATGSAWSHAFAPPEAGGAQIIGTLPVLGPSRAPQLLVFGHAEPQPSGHDETLLLMPANAAVPAAALWQARAGEASLVSLPGFLGAGDTQLREVLNLNPGTRIAGRCPRPIEV